MLLISIVEYIYVKLLGTSVAALRTRCASTAEKHHSLSKNDRDIISTDDMVLRYDRYCCNSTQYGIIESRFPG